MTGTTKGAARTPAAAKHEAQQKARAIDATCDLPPVDYQGIEIGQTVTVHGKSGVVVFACAKHGRTIHPSIDPVTKEPIPLVEPWTNTEAGGFLNDGRRFKASEIGTTSPKPETRTPAQLLRDMRTEPEEIEPEADEPEEMERDCMRCEETFSDDGTHDLCPACRANPNRTDMQASA